MNIATTSKVLPALLLSMATLAAQHRDAEAATHEQDASKPKVSFEQQDAVHLLRQYQLGCLSHLSYLVVSGGEAAVIDPQRDVEHYLADVARLGAKLKFTLLTHPHADFVAGHTELAAQTGAEILISDKAAAQFPHRPLRDGDQVKVGSVTLRAWATPGHTPNAMTFLLSVPGAKHDPAYALTGDTLFIGGIGRPDLLDVPPAELAAHSWDSLQRLKTLPDGALILPAHGAGSLCGAHLSPATSSTMGEEKATNPYLRMTSRASFIANLLSDQPVAPQYFGFNVQLNVKGPPRVERSTALPQEFESSKLSEFVASGGWVVDLRDQQVYANGHLPGSINIALRGRLDTWTGTVVPFGEPLLLVGNEAEVREGMFRLQRIGYDPAQVVGRWSGDAARWREAGLELRKTKLIQPKELHAAMQAGKEPLVIDVRTAQEYAELRLGDVGNIPVTDHARFAKNLDKQQSVLMVCNSAYRSSIAVGLAERAGFVDVASLDGGMDAWLSAGLPVLGTMASKVGGAVSQAAAASAIRLPEPIEAPQLRRLLLDQPQNYAVIDLRPAWQFAEWRIPGSVHVGLDGLAAHVTKLPESMRVVLVDRDGTTAFAVAGALMMQQSQRPLRALVGGVQAYWAGSAFTSASAPAPTASGTMAPPAPVPSTPIPAIKKRSAGC